MLEVSFENIEIREICENEDLAEERFGSVVAKSLKHRLADISAAKSIFDLVAGNLKHVKGAPTDCTIEVGSCFKLLFRASQTNLEKDKNGNINWSTVYRIKLLKISKSDNE